MRIVISTLAVLLAFQACFTLGKVHHKHHKRSLGTLDMTKTDKCEDHEYCSKYTQMDCASSFLKLNCKKLCGLCEGHKKINLPMVLYFKKHAGQKTRVERSAKPVDTSNWPVNEQKLFDYKGNYNHWTFQFNDKHPFTSKIPEPLKPADNAQQNGTPQQQNNDANQAAPAQQTQQQPEQQTQQPYQQQQQQQQQAAYPAQQQNTYQPQTSAPQPAAAPAPAAQAAQPAQPAAQAAQPAQPAVEQQQTQQQQQQQDVPAFRIPANAFKLADQGKDVYINVPQNGQTNNIMNQALNDQLQADKEKLKDEKECTTKMCFNYKPVKVPCPKGRECNWKGPNAPQINETFMVYCDDKFPNCGVLRSSCNESWLQIYCPKRCGICKPNDSQPQAAQPSPIAEDEGNKVYPSNVSELNDEPNVNIQSELVAPEPSDKPQRARYTLHVKPKLKNGVPQQQQIFIMPPNIKAGSNIKPLVILKQKVTKPMVENIEIDVPPKGIEYSDEPKVEVIEGSNHETLQVSQGKADLTKAEADLAQKNAAAQAPEAPAAQAPAPVAAVASQQAAPAADATAPAPAPAPAADATAAPAPAPAADAYTAPAPAADASAAPAPAPAPAADAYAAPAPAPAPAADATAAQAPAPAPAADASAAPAPAPASTETSQYNTQAQGYPDNTQTQAQTQQTQGYQDNTQTQTQGYQDNTQTQAAQTQSTQDQTAQSYQQPSYDQSQQAAAPTAAPTAAPAAYPAQDTQQTYG